MQSEDPFEEAERLAVEAARDASLIPSYIEATQKARELEGSQGWKKRSKMTQVEKILDHIIKTGSITQREAYLDYSIQSFHRRIADIRESGISLGGDLKTHATTGQEYTRYFFESEDDKSAAILRLSKIAA